MERDPTPWWYFSFRQCLRRNMTASTMITITTIVPKPINMGSSSLMSPGRPRAVPGPARRGGPVWSVPEGVLDLRSGLLGVALELLPAALGPQAPVAGQPADGLLGAA